jgi:hypothetical protein
MRSFDPIISFFQLPNKDTFPFIKKIISATNSVGTPPPQKMMGIVFKNVYCLCAVAVLSLAFQVYVLWHRHYPASIAYLLAAFICYAFTKNMTIVMSVSLLVGIAYVGIQRTMIIAENMENKTTAEDSESDDEGEWNGKNAATNKSKTIARPVGDRPPQSSMKKLKSKPMQGNDSGSESEVEEEEEGEEGEPEPSNESVKWKKTRKSSNTPRIDYASTIKTNYKDLNELLGEGGIESLTNQTKDLLQQQTKLAKAMQGISPLMNNANKLIKNFKSMNTVKDMGIF